jgi:hypothetical protein
VVHIARLHSNGWGAVNDLKGTDCGRTQWVSLHLLGGAEISPETSLYGQPVSRPRIERSTHSIQFYSVITVDDDGIRPYHKIIRTFGKVGFISVWGGETFVASWGGTSASGGYYSLLRSQRIAILSNIPVAMVSVLCVGPHALRVQKILESWRTFIKSSGFAFLRTHQSCCAIHTNIRSKSSTCRDSSKDIKKSCIRAAYSGTHVKQTSAGHGRMSNRYHFRRIRDGTEHEE